MLVIRVVDYHQPVSWERWNFPFSGFILSQLATLSVGYPTNYLLESRGKKKEESKISNDVFVHIHTLHSSLTNRWKPFSSPPLNSSHPSPQILCHFIRFLFHSIDQKSTWQKGTPFFCFLFFKASDEPIGISPRKIRQTCRKYVYICLYVDKWRRIFISQVKQPAKFLKI